MSVKNERFYDSVPQDDDLNSPVNSFKKIKSVFPRAGYPFLPAKTGEGRAAGNALLPYWSWKAGHDYVSFHKQICSLSYFLTGKVKIPLEKLNTLPAVRLIITSSCTNISEYAPISLVWLSISAQISEPNVSLC